MDFKQSLYSSTKTRQPNLKISNKGNSLRNRAPYLTSSEQYHALEEYMRLANEAIRTEDPVLLANIFRVTREGSFHEAVAAGLKAQPDKSFWASKLVDGNLTEMMEQHLACLKCFNQKQYVEAYNRIEVSASLFMNTFRDWESIWAMEALHELVFDVKELAQLADNDKYVEEISDTKMELAGQILIKIFGGLQKGQKRQGALYVANQLLKIYFKINKLLLGKNLLQVIDNTDFSLYPRKDKVTYYYFTGRMKMHDEKFAEADRRLLLAYEFCDKRHFSHTRRIMKFLIPVRTYVGLLSLPELLVQFGAEEFASVIEAVRTGNVALLRSTVHKHISFFLRSGLFLLVEPLELNVIRRIVKKIRAIQSILDPEKAHMIKLDHLVTAFKLQGVDCDVQEMEDYMCTLITKNLIKGYLSHRNRVLVLSKNDAFPHFREACSKDSKDDE